MPHSPFRYRRTLVNHPTQTRPLPVFEVAHCEALDETVTDAGSGHRVFTTLCSGSARQTLERLLRLEMLNYQLAKALPGIFAVSQEKRPA